VASHCVFCPQAHSDALGHEDQELVAGRVPERVVDRFEVVEVHVHDRKGPPLASHRTKPVLEAVQNTLRVRRGNSWVSPRLRRICCLSAEDGVEPVDPVSVILHKVKQPSPRRADPFRDLDVIDSRAPRFNQAVVGVVSVLAVVSGWWWLLAILAAQLVVGLVFGRRYCLTCLAYFELVQPVFGEGPLEDSRPTRFANMIGATVLTAASLSYLLGAAALGLVLGGLVAALALLATATGFCAGCEAYKLGHVLTGRRFVACPLPPRARSAPDRT